VTGAGVATICRGSNDSCVSDAFWRGIAAGGALLTMYEAPLAMRAHVFAEDLTAIAEDATGDWISTIEAVTTATDKAAIHCGAHSATVSRP